MSESTDDGQGKITEPEADRKDNRSDYRILFATAPDPENGGLVRWEEATTITAHDAKQARGIFRETSTDAEVPLDPEVRGRFLKAAESEHGALVRAVPTRSWAEDGAEPMQRIVDPRWA